jgi:hypothetical protein
VTSPYNPRWAGRPTDPKVAGKEDLHLPPQVTDIGDDDTFYGCKSQTNINIPTIVTHILPKAFSHCHSLCHIKNLHDGLTKTDVYTFIECQSLIVHIDIIPDSVAEVDYFCAFYQCVDVKALTPLPRGLQYV